MDRNPRFVAVGAALLATILILNACGKDSNPQPANEKSSLDEAGYFKSGDKITNHLAVNIGQKDAQFSAGRRSLEPFNTGNPVPASSYPWQVGLRISAGNNRWRCGGIIVSPRYILTAAHCVDTLDALDFSSTVKVEPKNIEVFHGNAKFGVLPAMPLDAAWGVKVHDLWKKNKSKPFAYDAALIRLSSPIPGAAPAPVQTADISNGSAIVSGWGYFDSTDVVSEVLRAVAVPITSPLVCTDHLQPSDRSLVTESTLCTVSLDADACGGDSGGPLVMGSRNKPQTVGIVSWGPPKRCRVAGPKGTLVGGYTKASSIANWVAEKTSAPDAVTSSPPEKLMEVGSALETSGGKDR